MSLVPTSLLTEMSEFRAGGGDDSLDETIPDPTEDIESVREDTKRLSGVDFIRLATTPTLDFCGMPLRPALLKERTYEISKSVTVTKVVSGAPENHPNSCEVTIQNSSQHGGNPINVKITNLQARDPSKIDVTTTETSDPKAIFRNIPEIGPRAPGKSTVVDLIPEYSTVFRPSKGDDYVEEPDRIVFEDTVRIRDTTTPIYGSSVESIRELISKRDTSVSPERDLVTHIGSSNIGNTVSTVTEKARMDMVEKFQTSPSQPQSPDSFRRDVPIEVIQSTPTPAPREVPITQLQSKATSESSAPIPPTRRPKTTPSREEKKVKKETLINGDLPEVLKEVVLNGSDEDALEVSVDVNIEKVNKEEVPVKLNGKKTVYETSYETTAESVTKQITLSGVPDVQFNKSSDNVIDITFTTPLPFTGVPFTCNVTPVKGIGGRKIPTHTLFFQNDGLVDAHPPVSNITPPQELEEIGPDDVVVDLDIDVEFESEGNTEVIFHPTDSLYQKLPNHDEVNVEITAKAIPSSLMSPESIKGTPFTVEEETHVIEEADLDSHSGDSPQLDRSGGKESEEGEDPEEVFRHKSFTGEYQKELLAHVRKSICEVPAAEITNTVLDQIFDSLREQDREKMEEADRRETSLQPSSSPSGPSGMSVTPQIHSLDGAVMVEMNFSVPKAEAGGGFRRESFNGGGSTLSPSQAPLKPRRSFKHSKRVDDIDWKEAFQMHKSRRSMSGEDPLLQMGLTSSATLPPPQKPQRKMAETATSVPASPAKPPRRMLKIPFNTPPSDLNTSIGSISRDSDNVHEDHEFLPSGSGTSIEIKDDHRLRSFDSTSSDGRRRYKVLSVHSTEHEQAIDHISLVADITREGDSGKEEKGRVETRVIGESDRMETSNKKPIVSTSDHDANEPLSTERQRPVEEVRMSSQEDDSELIPMKESRKTEKLITEDKQESMLSSDDKVETTSSELVTGEVDDQLATLEQSTSVEPVPLPKKSKTRKISDLDLEKVFSGICLVTGEKRADEKDCNCNACLEARLSVEERERRWLERTIEKQRTRKTDVESPTPSRKTADEYGSNIDLDEIFNPKSPSPPATELASEIKKESTVDSGDVVRTETTFPVNEEEKIPPVEINFDEVFNNTHSLTSTVKRILEPKKFEVASGGSRFPIHRPAPEPPREKMQYDANINLDEIFDPSGALSPPKPRRRLSIIAPTEENPFDYVTDDKMTSSKSGAGGENSPFLTPQRSPVPARRLSLLPHEQHSELEPFSNSPLAPHDELAPPPKPMRRRSLTTTHKESFLPIDELFHLKGAAKDTVSDYYSESPISGQKGISVQEDEDEALIDTDIDQKEKSIDPIRDYSSTTKEPSAAIVTRKISPLLESYAEDLLAKVFANAGICPVGGEDKECTCSACRDSKLTPEELLNKQNEFLIQKAASSARESPIVSRRPPVTSDICLEDIFSSEGNEEVSSPAKEEADNEDYYSDAPVQSRRDPMKHISKSEVLRAAVVAEKVMDDVFDAIEKESKVVDKETTKGEEISIPTDALGNVHNKSESTEATSPGMSLSFIENIVGEESVESLGKTGSQVDGSQSVKAQSPIESPSTVKTVLDQPSLQEIMATEDELPEGSTADVMTFSFIENIVKSSPEVPPVRQTSEVTPPTVQQFSKPSTSSTPSLKELMKEEEEKLPEGSTANAMTFSFIEGLVSDSNVEIISRPTDLEGETSKMPSAPPMSPSTVEADEMESKKVEAIPKSEISLEDVFNIPETTTTSSLVRSSLVPDRPKTRYDTPTYSPQRIVPQTQETKRISDLPKSDISLDDIFAPGPQDHFSDSVVVTESMIVDAPSTILTTDVETSKAAEMKPTSSYTPSWRQSTHEESPSLRAHRTSPVEIDLDAVFSGTLPRTTSVPTPSKYSEITVVDTPTARALAGREEKCSPFRDIPMSGTKFSDAIQEVHEIPYPRTDKKRPEVLSETPEREVLSGTKFSDSVQEQHEIPTTRPMNIIPESHEYENLGETFVSCGSKFSDAIQEVHEIPMQRSGNRKRKEQKETREESGTTLEHSKSEPSVIDLNDVFTIPPAPTSVKSTEYYRSWSSGGVEKKQIPVVIESELYPDSLIASASTAERIPDYLIPSEDYEIHQELPLDDVQKRRASDVKIEHIERVLSSHRELPHSEISIDEIFAPSNVEESTSGHVIDSEDYDAPKGIPLDDYQKRRSSDAKMEQIESVSKSYIQSVTLLRGKCPKVDEKILAAVWPDYKPPEPSPLDVPPKSSSSPVELRKKYEAPTVLHTTTTYYHQTPEGVTSQLHKQDGLMEAEINYPSTSHSMTSSQIEPEAVEPTEMTKAEKRVSTATLVLDDSHATTSGVPDDDSLIKLVFSGAPKQIELVTSHSSWHNKPQPTSSHDNLTPSSGRTSPLNSSIDLSYAPSNFGFSRDFGRSYDQTLTTSETPQKFKEQKIEVVNEHNRKDEEVLEVEVTADYYVIKGNYSIVISRSDPLGILLESLQSSHSGDCSVSDMASLDFSLAPRLRKLLYSCLKEKKNGSEFPSLSHRAQQLISNFDSATSTYQSMNFDHYDSETNPTGNLNLCTAENAICEDLIIRKASECLQYSNKKANIDSEMDHLLHYGPAGGYHEVKTSLVRYFTSFMNADALKTEELVIAPGCNSAYDMISYTAFEADDLILSMAPVYSRVFNNVEERAHCRIIAVPLENPMEPKLDIAAYERAIDMYSDQGETVKGLVIINPNNPLGVCFSSEEVIKICNWANRNNIFVIVDEIFAGSVYSPDANFESFLSYRHKLENPQNTAWIWSPSKDFGLPGVKLSTIVCSDLAMIRALTRLEVLQPCSALAQDFVTKLLENSDWLSDFHLRKIGRLRAHRNFVSENLRHLNVPYVEAVAGVCLFCNFSRLIPSRFPNEDELVSALAQRGVFLSPGRHMGAAQHGWLRIVFACKREELEEGIRRLHKFLGGSADDVVGKILYPEQTPPPKGRSRGLSFLLRRAIDNRT